MLFLCGRTGTGRYEYQLWNAAAEGAIEDVKITEHGVEFTCIDGKEPVGICGSGILAVLKELIRTGLVRKNGAFVKKKIFQKKITVIR